MRRLVTLHAVRKQKLTKPGAELPSPFLQSRIPAQTVPFPLLSAQSSGPQSPFPQESPAWRLFLPLPYKTMPGLSWVPSGRGCKPLRET